MRQNIYIRKLFAITLMVVFALSITPTKVLHSFFADHTDASLNKTYSSKNPGLSVAGFNCQCNNLVVESPFTIQYFVAATDIFEIYDFNKQAFAPDFNCADHFFFELRGPPSIA
ncbi:MAG: hypothetical protein ABIO76_06065 [Ginsengibacter sp.]